MIKLKNDDELIIRHGIKEDALEKIELEVFEKNTVAIGLYKKFGFIVEGVKNNSIKIDDKYEDLFLLAKFLKFN